MQKSNQSSQQFERLSSSLRDPAGFLFEHNGLLCRAVNQNYKKHFDLLLSSGLYDKLINNNLLVKHIEIDAHSLQSTLPPETYKVLQMERLPFISYPFEWCFSQLQDAALLTLELQKTALELGMSLKDASAHNIQFIGAQPIFIDTLSFEEHTEGSPWVAYGQFCRHFIAPLALMSYRDDRLSHLLNKYIDGLPLDLAADLLPIVSWSNLSLLRHLFLHAKAQYLFKDTKEIKTPEITTTQLKALVDDLYKLVKGLKIKECDSVWSEYYASECNYSDESLNSKYTIVEKFIELAKPNMVWDLGSNDGKFSRIASQQNIFTVAMDGDHNSTENNYLLCCKDKDKYLLPLLIDLTNPSASLGWANSETKSLVQRGPVDMMMALAVVHHLVITHSLSLNSIAKSFASLCDWLIVEFVPETDSQIKRLLKSNPDSFFAQRYNQSIFEMEFTKFFSLEQKIKIEQSERVLYLFRNQSKLT